MQIIPCTALDKLRSLNDGCSRTLKERLNESPLVRSVGKRAFADVIILAIILLLFITEGADEGTTFKPHYIKSTFCVDNHLLPSFFVIGIQKCGTTTLDAILKQFEEISHG